MFKKGDRVILKSWEYSEVFGSTKSIVSDLKKPRAKKKVLIVTVPTRDEDGGTKVVGLESEYTIHELDLELAEGQPSFKELAKEYEVGENHYTPNGIKLKRFANGPIQIGNTFMITKKEKVNAVCLCLLALAEDME